MNLSNLKKIKFNLTYLLVVLVAFLIVPNLSAKTSKGSSEYAVEVIYTDCENGAQSRAEVWKDIRTRKTVYVEVRDCEGKTTKTSEKPVVWTYQNENLWDYAKAVRNPATQSMAEAIAMYLPPVKADTVERNVELPDGTILVGYQIDYEFYFEMSLEDEIAKTIFDHNDNAITLTTDKLVKIKIIDLTTGIDITDFITVENNHTLDISTLDSGCKYVFAVYQTFDSVGDILVKSYNFCK